MTNTQAMVLVVLAGGLVYALTRPGPGVLAAPAAVGTPGAAPPADPARNQRIDAAAAGLTMTAGIAALVGTFLPSLKQTQGATATATTQPNAAALKALANTVKA